MYKDHYNHEANMGGCKIKERWDHNILPKKYTLYPWNILLISAWILYHVSSRSALRVKLKVVPKELGLCNSLTTSSNPNPMYSVFG